MGKEGADDEGGRQPAARRMLSGDRDTKAATKFEAESEKPGWSRSSETDKVEGPSASISRGRREARSDRGRDQDRRQNKKFSCSKTRSEMLQSASLKTVEKSAINPKKAVEKFEISV